MKSVTPTQTFLKMSNWKMGKKCVMHGPKIHYCANEKAIFSSLHTGFVFIALHNTTYWFEIDCAVCNNFTNLVRRGEEGVLRPY